MYPTRPSLIVALLVSFLTVASFAQTHSAKTAPSGNFEQYVAYWTAEAGWKTEVLLKNNLPSQSLTVTPVLRTPDGSESALAPVTIKANDVVTVDLGQAITSSAPALTGAYGSMALRYSAAGVGVLLSAVMVELPGTPIEFHLDGWFPDEPTAKPIPGSREGIWWLPRESAKDWLIITNAARNPAPANLVLYDASGKSWQQKIVLGARQMQRLSVRALLHESGLTGSFGGIEIDLPNGMYSVDTAHIVYDEANGSLTVLKMFDHDPQAMLIQRSLTDKQWTIRAPMLALSNPGAALALPEKTVLQPAIFLRNASAKSYAAQLTFNWRSDIGKGKSTSAVLLRPHETRFVDVAALQANGTIPASAHWAYVSISAPINPDELLAVATSFDATGKFGAQTPFSDQVATHWEGGKWEVDANHNTLISVGNAGTTASKTLVTIYYNSAQGRYEFEQTLGPDEQLWLEMGKLIGNQIPDRNGKTIPPDVMSGTYEIRDLTNKEGVGLFEGKLVVDKTFGHAVHGCAGCCAWAQAHTYYNPMDMAVGTGEYQQVWATETCTLQVEEVYLLQPVSWSTGNTSIATANNNAYIWGVAAGSTTQYGSGYLQSNVPPRSCPNSLRNVQAQTNVSCAVPTNYRQTSGSADSNGILHFTYAWDSSTGKLTDLSACTVREYVTYPGQSPFNWPSPPYLQASTPFPVTQGGPGTAGSAPDTHGYPGFQMPYQANSFNATQYYQYICPCANNGNAVNLMGPLTIARQVYFSSPDGKWHYQASKSGVIGDVVLPNQ